MYLQTFPIHSVSRMGERNVLSIIDRYLLKELTLTLMATELILLAMVLSNRLAGYLSQVANGLLARDAIYALLGLQAIRFLVILTPLALLLSIMLALGRLYRDSEMVALAACGNGPGAIYRPLFVLAVPLAVALTALSFYVVPYCMDLQFELQARARKDAEVSMFTPGTFREINGGHQVVYVGALQGNGRELEKIFIQNQTPNGVAITTGERGYQQIDPQSGIRYITLNDGYRYEGIPGQGDYQIVNFRRLSVRVDSAPAEQAWQHRETIPSRELFGATDLSHIAELHHRFSGPIAALIVTFMAPLLARARPKEGRYARLVAAVLIYTVYTNLLEIGQSWLSHGRLWPGLGLWWVHGLFALVGGGIWFYQCGIWAMKKMIGSERVQ